MGAYKEYPLEVVRTELSSNYCRITDLGAAWLWRASGWLALGLYMVQFVEAHGKLNTDVADSDDIDYTPFDYAYFLCHNNMFLAHLAHASPINSQRRDGSMPKRFRQDRQGTSSIRCSRTGRNARMPDMNLSPGERQSVPPHDNVQPGALWQVVQAIVRSDVHVL